MTSTRRKSLRSITNLDRLNAVKRKGIEPTDTTDGMPLRRRDSAFDAQGIRAIARYEKENVQATYLRPCFQTKLKSLRGMAYNHTAHEEGCHCVFLDLTRFLHARVFARYAV